MRTQVERHLHTNPKPGAKGQFQCRARQLDRERVKVLLGRHLEDYSFNELNAPMSKEAGLEEPIVFLAAPEVSFRADCFYDGHCWFPRSLTSRSPSPVTVP